MRMQAAQVKLGTLVLFFAASLISALEFANHGLYWSGSLRAPASIVTTGTWQMIQNANVSMTINQPKAALISYDLDIEGLREQTNYIVPREGNTDIIQVRCIIDGIPYRYSSSYGSTYMVEEHLFARATSSFVVDLSVGEHSVSLQWKKTGTAIQQWVVSSGAQISSGFSLSVQADYKHLWHMHEMSDTIIYQQAMWKAASGNLSFSLPRDSVVTLGFSMVVQPQLTAFIKDRSMEFVTANLKVNGVAYTESAATHGSNPWNPTAATLTGVVTMNMEAGNHYVQLQWRKLGSIFKSWGSTPSYLDGFATSRNVFVSVSKMSTPSLQAYTKQVLKNDGLWVNVGNSVQSFELIKESAVLITYALPVTQHENPLMPDFDSNVWNPLTEVQTRLLVDDVAYVHEGGRTLTTGSRRVEELFGDLGLVLAAGSHTVVLQWKSDGIGWMTLNDLADGFAHGERLLTFISSENSQPTITAPFSVTGDEDIPFNIDGVSIDDIDAKLEPGILVNMNITVTYGAISFLETELLALEISYEYGVDSTTIIMVDTIANINTALGSMQYTSPPLWNGEDVLALSLSDVKNIGFSADGAASMAHQDIAIIVEPVDNAFTLTLPTVQAGLSATEWNVLDPLVLFDTDSQESVFHVNLAVACGVLSLNDTSDLLFISGDGISDQTMDFQGTYSAVVASLMSISFLTNDACNSGVHGEFLYVRVLYPTVAAHDISGYIPLEVIRENVAPHIVMDGYPRWKIEGLTISRLAETVEYTQYPIYVTTSMEPAGADIIVENYNKSSSMSELSILETADGQYALSVQFMQINVMMTSSTYIQSGFAKEVTLELTSIIDSEASSFQCVIGDEAFPATFVVNTTRLTCTVLFTVSGLVSSETKTLWLSVVYTNSVQNYRTNFVPLYVTELPLVYSLSTYGSFANGRNAIHARVSNIKVVDTCFVITAAGSEYAVEAVADGSNYVTCRFPEFSEADVVSLAAEVQVGSADKYFRSNSMSVALYSDPVISSTAVLADYSNHGDAVLAVTGDWTLESLEYVEHVKCLINGDVELPVLVFSGQTVSCALSSTLLLEMYLTNSSADALVMLIFDHHATEQSLIAASTFADAYAAAAVLGLPVYSDATDDVLDVFSPQIADSSISIVLSSISPATGSTAGGALVTITGTGFDISSDLYCKFDRYYSRATYSASDGTLLCSTPPHPAGVSSVVIVADDFVTPLAGALSFVYVQSHSVESLVPAAGLVTGGTEVTVTGQGFAADAAAVCQFGSKATVANVVSDSVITCSSPAGEDVGVFSFSVVLDGQSSSGSAVSYRYLSPMVISGCYPEFGSDTGGNTVHVYGLAFVAVATTTCLFGAVSSPARVLSSTVVECMAPVVAGNSSVSLGLTVDGHVFQAEDGSVMYTYSPSRFISELEPSVGFTTGNTSVTITGAGFKESSNFVCVFDEAFIPAWFVNETAVACTTVAHAPAVVAFRLVVDGMDAYELLGGGSTFTFYPPLTVSAMSPVSCSTAGQCLVVLTGTGFDASTLGGSSFSCQFGDALAPAVLTTDGTLICMVPNRDAAGSVMLSILIEDEVATSAGVFRYFDQSVVLSSSPAVGSADGGNAVVIRGLSFVSSVETTCIFGTQTSQGRVFNSTAVECVVPAPEDGMLTVAVGLNFSDYAATSDVTYAYVEGSVVSGFAPAVGFVSGGSVVSVQGSGFRFGASYGCVFGDVETVAILISSNKLSCRSVSRTAAGVASFRVVEEDEVVVGSVAEFTYMPLITIDSMEPHSGSILGSTAVSILGSGFILASDNALNVTCWFGNVSTDAVIVSDDEISCLSPAVASKATVPVTIMVGTETITSSLLFHFANQVEVYAVHPPFGNVQGGNEVIILGAGFAAFDKAECIFGSSSSAARVLNGSAMECIVPAKSDADHSTVNVSLVLDGLFSEPSLLVTYTFVSHLSISELSPSFGSTRGGFDLLVTGTGFRYDIGMSCIIGDTLNPAVFVSETMLLCLTPAHTAGLVDVSLSINGAFSEQRVEPLTFTFISPPVVVSASPSGGSEYGGTVVTVIGSGFLPIAGAPVHDVRVAQYEQISCKFDSEIVDAMVLDYNTIQCMSPASTGGNTVELTIVANGEVASGSSSFTFGKPSMVSNCEPDHGSVTGGTVIMCNGLSLTASASAECRFGDMSTPARVVSSTLVECLSPASGATGDVNLTVHMDGYTVPSEVIAFTYVDTITLSSVEPAMGPSQGGTTVTVTGTGFSSSEEDLYCVFGDKASAAYVLSDTSLECQSVAHITGDAVLTVFGYNVQAVSGTPLVFKYMSNLRVTSVYPAAGPMAGGQLLTVLGSGFAAHQNSGSDLLCGFGSATVVASVVGDGVLTCVTPASHTSGVLALSVSLKDTVSTGSIYFRYLSPMAISGCYPESGSYAGGETVIIFGLSFVPAASTTCLFGALSSPARVLSSTAVECLAPVYAGMTSVSLGVTVDGYTEYGASATYRFVDELVITQIEPQFASTQGGSNITIRGSGFTFEADLQCLIDEILIPSRFVSSSEIVCESATHAAGSVDLRVMTVDSGVQSNVVSLVYTSSPSVYSVSISTSHLLPGSKVHVSGVGFLNENVNQSQFGCAFSSALDAQGGTLVATVHSDTLMTCSCPEIGTNVEKIVVQVILVANVLFIEEFATVPAIVYVGAAFPSFATVGINSAVRVYGGPFHADLVYTCSVGGNLFPLAHSAAVVLSANMLMCATTDIVTEAMATTLVVSELLMGEVYSFPFAYLEQPVIDTVHFTGDSHFGLRVSLSGVDATSMEWKCRFGNLLHSAVSLSETELLCALSTVALSTSPDVAVMLTVESTEGHLKSAQYKILPSALTKDAVVFEETAASADLQCAKDSGVLRYRNTFGARSPFAVGCPAGNTSNSTATGLSADEKRILDYRSWFGHLATAPTRPFGDAASSFDYSSVSEAGSPVATVTGRSASSLSYFSLSSGMQRRDATLCTINKKTSCFNNGMEGASQSASSQFEPSTASEMLMHSSRYLIIDNVSPTVLSLANDTWLLVDGRSFSNNTACRIDNATLLDTIVMSTSFLQCKFTSGLGAFHTFRLTVDLIDVASNVASVNSVSLMFAEINPSLSAFSSEDALVIGVDEVNSRVVDSSEEYCASGSSGDCDIFHTQVEVNMLQNSACNASDSALSWNSFLDVSAFGSSNMSFCQFQDNMLAIRKKIIASEQRGAELSAPSSPSSSRKIVMSMPRSMSVDIPVSERVVYFVGANNAAAADIVTPSERWCMRYSITAESALVETLASHETTSPCAVMVDQSSTVACSIPTSLVPGTLDVELLWMCNKEDEAVYRSTLLLHVPLTSAQATKAAATKNYERELSVVGLNDWTKTADNSEIITQVTVVNVAPIGGVLTGGTVLTVTGNDLADVLACVFTVDAKSFTTAATLVEGNNGAAQCHTPAVGTIGRALIDVVSATTGKAVSTGFSFDFYVQPDITYASLVDDFNKTLVISGNNFPSFTRSICKVVTSASTRSAFFPGYSVSENAINCGGLQEEALHAAGGVLNEVFLTFNGVDYVPVALVRTMNLVVDRLSSDVALFNKTTPSETMVFSSPAKYESVVLDTSNNQFSAREAVTHSTVCDQPFIVPVSLSNVEQADSIDCVLYATGSVVVVSGRYVSSNKIACALPSQPPGIYDLVVNKVSGEQMATSVHLRCVNQAKIMSGRISPQSLFDGSTDVVFSAINLDRNSAYTLLLGNQHATGMVHSTNTMSFTLATLSPGLVDMHVSMQGNDATLYSANQLCINATVLAQGSAVSLLHSTKDACSTAELMKSVNDEVSEAAFRAKAASNKAQVNRTLVIRSQTPHSGLSLGSTAVEIVADGFVSSFSSDVKCHFGTVAVDAVVINIDRILCYTPILPPQNVSLTVSSSTGDLWCCGWFSFYPVLRLSSLSPMVVDSRGGSVVKIKLHNDVQSAMHLFCYFDNSSVVPAQILSARLVSCVSPVSTAASITVSVGSAYESWSDSLTTMTSGYATLTKLSPNRGSRMGDTHVTVFVPASVALYTKPLCLFGTWDIDSSIYTTSAAVVITSDEEKGAQMLCTTPSALPAVSSSVNKVPVYVIDAATSEDSIKALAPVASFYVGTFTYEYPAEITAISPTVVTHDVEADLLVFGVHFLDNDSLSCVINNSTVVPARWFAQSMVACTIPPVTLLQASRTDASSVSVRVSNNGGADISSSEVRLAVIADIFIKSVSPLTGFILSSTAVEVVLLRPYFGRLDCNFASTQVLPAIQVEPTRFVCVSPELASAGDVSLEIVTSASTVLSTSTFTFAPVPVLSKTNAGADSAAATVLADVESSFSLEGSNFDMRTTARVVTTTGAVLTSGECLASSHRKLSCSVTAPSTEDFLLVEISVNGKDFLHNFALIQVFTPSSVVSVDPLYVGYRGGNAIGFLLDESDTGSATFCRFATGRGGAKVVAEVQAVFTNAQQRLDVTDISGVGMECIAPPLPMNEPCFLSIVQTGGLVIYGPSQMTVLAEPTIATVSPAAILAGVHTTLMLTFSDAQFSFPARECVFQGELFTFTLVNSLTGMCSVQPMLVSTEGINTAAGRNVSALYLQYKSVPKSGVLASNQIAVVDSSSVGYHMEKTAILAFSSSELTITSDECHIPPEASCHLNGFVSKTTVKTAIHSACSLTCTVDLSSTPVLPENNQMRLDVCLTPHVHSCGLPLFSQIVTVIPGMAITALRPSKGSAAGGGVVTVFGAGFVMDSSLFCQFGLNGRTTLAVVSSATKLWCELPAGAPGNVSVALQRQGIHVLHGSSLSPKFEYLPLLSRIVVEPSRVSSLGGTVVYSTTQGLISKGPYSCRFTDVQVPAIVLNSSMLSCISPAYDFPNVSFALTIDGADISTEQFLVVAKPPTVMFIDPTLMAASMPSDVTVMFNAADAKVGTGSVQCFLDDVRKPSSYEAKMHKCCIACDEKGNMGALPVGLHEFKLMIDDVKFFAVTIIARSPFQIQTIQPLASFASVSTAVTMRSSQTMSDGVVYSMCCFGDGMKTPAMLISQSEIQCFTPRWTLPPGNDLVTVPVGLANAEGVCEFYGFDFKFFSQPKAISVEGAVGSAAGGTAVVTHFASPLPMETIYCRVGYAVSVGQILNGNSVLCITSSTRRALPFSSSVEGRRLQVSGYSSQSSPVGDVPIEVSSNGLDFMSTGFDFTFVPVVISDPTIIDNSGGNTPSTDPTSPMDPTDPVTPEVVTNMFALNVHDGVSVEPSFGPRNVQTSIMVKGFNLNLTDPNSLTNDYIVAYCLVGMDYNYAIQVTATQVGCVAPTSQSFAGKVRVQLTDVNKNPVPGTAFFEYITDPVIFSVEPSIGSAASDLLMYGTGFKRQPSLSCIIGDEAVPTFIISDSIVICQVPVLIAGHYDIHLQTNGQHFVRSGISFEYREQILLSQIKPSNGPAMRGGTVVSIYGTGFVDSTNIYCIFDMTYAPAVFISEEVVQCKLPPHRPGMVNVSLVADGALLHPLDNSLEFLYTADASVDKITPEFGYTSGEFPVLIMGTNFVNTTALGCMFADMKSRGIYLSNTSMMCLSPSILGRPALKRDEVFLEVTVNGFDYTSSKVVFSYSEPCDAGFFCPGMTKQLCPNGTYCPPNSRNFTICEPGTFQPKEGGESCVLCPVGSLCPDHGMSRPINCIAGLICDAMGLRSSVKLCPMGHYCLNNTKAANVAEFAGTETNSWNVDYVTGVVSFDPDTYNWNYTIWPPPAVGRSRALHPPEDSCDGLVCFPGSQTFPAEAPLPCPIGHYCRAGVGSQIPMPKNFSSPQRCFDGYFCPRGSVSPEGSGPCPNGYFCPTQLDALACPPGHYCPGVGNTAPLECYPGTYNPFEQQANCTVCPSGYICPGWGVLLPEPCPAGFVCTALGLSFPVILCPTGYWCGEGTLSMDPSSSTPNKPYACEAGQFCLGGVAGTGETVEWIPAQPWGVTFPQGCNEGTYCEVGSYRTSGSGLCFRGHYCPPRTDFPTKTPRGSYASALGSVAPTLCYPGTYASLLSQVDCAACPSGHTCVSYGTYKPSICPPGTYRTQVDSVTCSQCQVGTYSDEVGASDMSLCLPCPAGRICGTKSLTTLANSVACPAGYMCGYGTDRGAQFNHLAPAGFNTPLESTPYQQFDNMCISGFYCLRGTPDFNAQGGKCPVGSFCPPASPAAISADTKCPAVTTSLSGISEVQGCRINSINVCDKTLVDETNPMDYVTYYSTFSYDLLDDSDITLEFESSLSSNKPTGEIMVVEKINPINLTSSSPYWVNDTIEAFRSCPLYGSGVGGDVIQIVGRNFRDTHLNYCKFRACYVSNLGRHPRRCANQINSPTGEALPAVGNVSEASFITRARYISPTRMECTTPEFLFQALNDFEPPEIALYKCEYIDHFGVRRSDGHMNDTSFGNFSYSRKCDDPTVCINEPSIGEEWFASLTLPCTPTEIYEKTCGDKPEPGYMFNPCMSAEVVVEITNDGEHYSGGVELGGTSILSTTRYNEEGEIYNNFKNWTVKATFAVYTFLYPEYWYANSEILNMEREYCNIPRYSEESERKRETYWYPLQLNSVAHVQMDFSHLPTNFIYAQHYKIAIFVLPSRCTVELCSTARVRLSPEEFLPCRKPVDLSYWFTRTYVPKNVKNNITVYALDDVIIKVEVHILHGLYRTYAPLFRNTTTVRIAQPERAQTFTGLTIAGTETRPLSQYISFEQKLIPTAFFFCAVVNLEDTTYVSQPLNTPPLYKEYERGRVLLMNNVSYDNDAVPLVLDQMEDINAGTNFWMMPATTSSQSKELLDAYFETFHGTTYDAINGYVFNFYTMLLPYMPYMSNCYGFDSYMPFWLLLEGKECALPDYFAENWYRYKFDPLPDQDSIRFVGPFNFFEYPVADWCERDVYCNYEEDLTGVDNTPRWFELTGGALFTFIRVPLMFSDYTGRKGTFISQGDAGGALAIENLRAESGDNFIAVNIDHALGDVIPGCDVGFQCMARSYTLSIAYYQVDNYVKKIIWITLAGDLYDFNQLDTSYQLHVSFFALGFLDLIITFAFPIIIFMLIFVVLGFTAVLLTIVGWIMCRITTTLQNPPQLKFVGMLKLTLPPPAAGVNLAILLILIMTSSGNYFVNGFFYTDPNAPVLAPYGTLMLDDYALLYADIGNIIGEDEYALARTGRIGSVFAIVGFQCLYAGTKMYFPKSETKRDRELAKKRTPLATKKDTWDPIAWRKNNFLFSSFACALFLVLVVELSFWTYFGDFIYVIIVMLLIFAEFVAALVEFVLRDAMLMAPLLASYEFVQQLVTFGSPDFLAFLLAYFLGAAVSMFQRVFQNFYLDGIFGSISYIVSKVVEGVQKIMPKYLTKAKNAQEAADMQAAAKALEEGKKRQVEGVQEAQESESVEPILDYFTDVCSDTMILFYYPFFVYLLMQYREQIQIPIIYEIKQSDMLIYLVFQCFMLFAEPLVDVFNHSQCELFHGWKIYEYLVYSRYRYLQRETRWKGMENSLDECIDEALRTIDQMCFSSQYFVMLTIHTNGIIYIMLAFEVWLRVNYSPFSDSGFATLVIFMTGVYILVEWLVTTLAVVLKVWKIKHENTAWHLQQTEEDDMDLPGWEEVKGASSDAYLMNQRITSDTFRNKFLNYNRTWLINQLPQILTPRTMRRSRPYLINQFARIINAKRDDISDDSDNDDKDKKFGPVALSAASRNIVRWWLGKAKRRIRLRNIVEPLIKRARGAQCEQCLSRKQLQVEYEIEVDQMADMYDNAFPGDEEVDQVQWKQFWVNNQRYHTICLACLTKRKEVDARNASKGNYDPSIFDDGQEDYPDWGPVFLTAASKAMLLNWYRKAQRIRAGKRGARKKEKKIKEISDDEGDDAGHRWLKDMPPVSEASKAIAVFWMRTARARLQKKNGKGNSLRDKELVAQAEAAEMLTETFRSGKKSAALKK